jgi:ArsR family transcriptional regulator, virulence genes transcriptional regulator
MDPHEMLKDPKLVELQSAICKIMSNPRRVQILHLLDGGERSVGELVEMTGLRKAAVSQNLGLMRERNLVSARRDGQKVYYSLRSQRLLSACNSMEALLKELVQLEEEVS